MTKTLRCVHIFSKLFVASNRHTHRCKPNIVAIDSGLMQRTRIACCNELKVNAIRGHRSPSRKAAEGQDVEVARVGGPAASGRTGVPAWPVARHVLGDRVDDRPLIRVAECGSNKQWTHRPRRADATSPWTVDGERWARLVTPFGPGEANGAGSFPFAHRDADPHAACPAPVFSLVPQSLPPTATRPSGAAPHSRPGATTRAPGNGLCTVVAIAQGTDHALQDPERT